MLRILGRLGYACLNTVLRAEKPESIFCSRTCRKDTITKNGLDFAKSLGLQNCRDLVKLIEVISVQYSNICANHAYTVE